MSAGVVICGGGTGGHINPGLAVAQELSDMGMSVSWLGTKGGMEEKLVAEAGLPIHTVRFAAPKGGFLGKLACLLRLVPAVVAARRILRKLDAKVVLGLGGYPSLPGVLASIGGLARRLVHEQNVIPGLANRVLAPFAHGVLTSHPQTLSKYNVLVTGNPIRKQFAEIAEPAERFEGREGKLRLLVMGGSQGARSLNVNVPLAVAKAGNWTVEHAAGASGVESTKGEYERHKIEAEVKEYFSDIDARMARADLVISRAGAATVAEIAAVGVASILVPYPHARAHQKANAAMLVGHGAALQISDGDIARPGSLASLLQEVSDRGRLLKMAAKARGLGHADAAKKVALACKREMGDV